MSAPVHPFSDYGVALRTLRSGRNMLGVLLFVCVMLQIFGFIMMRFTTQPYVGSQIVARGHLTRKQVHRIASGRVRIARVGDEGQMTPGRQVVENYMPRKWSAILRQSRRLNLRRQWKIAYYLAVPVTQLLGVLASASQAVLIFVTLLVMLVSGAPGIAHVTRSFFWSVVLLFIVIPWQYVLPGFPIPGILYGWHELIRTLDLSFLPAPGHGIPAGQRALIVARYVLWPVVGLVVMLVTAERFRAGTRLAIGHPLQSLLTKNRPGTCPTSTHDTLKTELRI
ncbi:MAG: hypothetical protein ACP5O1_09235 [Phycisphaerae bacterium]